MFLLPAANYQTVPTMLGGMVSPINIKEAGNSSFYHIFSCTKMY